MTQKRRTARLALQILSGRQNPFNLDMDDFALLGYDTFKFGAFGRPEASEIKERAVEILLDLIAPPVPELSVVERVLDETH